MERTPVVWPASLDFFWPFDASDAPYREQPDLILASFNTTIQFNVTKTISISRRCYSAHSFDADFSVPFLSSDLKGANMILITFGNMSIVQHACTHHVDLPEGLVQTVDGIEDGFAKMSLPKAWNFTFELAAPTMSLEIKKTEVTSIVFDFLCDFDVTLWSAVRYACTATSETSSSVSTPRAVTQDRLRHPF